MLEKEAYHGRIVQDQDILLGKPVVRGMRIPVELVLAKLAANPNLDALLIDYPHLTVDDVRACLQYAAVLVEQQYRARKPPPAPSPAHRTA